MRKFLSFAYLKRRVEHQAFVVSACVFVQFVAANCVINRCNRVESFKQFVSDDVEVIPFLQTVALSRWNVKIILVFIRIRLVSIALVIMVRHDVIMRLRVYWILSSMRDIILDNFLSILICWIHYELLQLAGCYRYEENKLKMSIQKFAVTLLSESFNNF